MSEKASFKLTIGEATTLYYLLKTYSESDNDLISKDKDLFMHLRKKFEKQFPNAEKLSQHLDNHS